MTTLILGAGMAGIMAARSLQKDYLILEARQRPGGRVHTDYTFGSHPVEFGAEFLHGEKIPTWQYVRELNLQTVIWQRQEDALVRLADGALHPMPEARRLYPDFDQTRTWDFTADPQAGESFADYLRRIGFTDTQLHYMQRTFANAHCDSAENFSAVETFQNIGRRVEYGTEDHRILAGYQVLIDHLVQGLNIEFSQVVSEIHWQAGKVKTAEGREFSGQKIILTLPLGVLKSGQIRFIPELPASKLDAMAKLAMRPATKLIYHFPHPILPPEISSFYSQYNPPMWWSPSFSRQNEGQIWTAFATGDWAADLLEDGEEAALDHALEMLRKELGQPDLLPLARACVNWAADPFTLGGYSTALVGGESAREELAKPLADKLFWAGEATAPNTVAATVHGAYLTGIRAAQESLG